MNKFNEQTLKLGHFDPAKSRFSLAAIKKALNSSRIRWLIGIKKGFAEIEKVYRAP